MLAASAGFAGGVMLTASLADLMPEALEFYSGYLQPLPCGGAIVTLLALGMLTAGLLGRLLPEAEYRFDTTEEAVAAFTPKRA